MKLANPVTYLAKHFTWSQNQGITDASDIGCTSGIPGAKIYDDAADHGFLVKGRTRDILFLFIDFLRDREGDLQGWKYRSECGNYLITIVND